MPWRLQKDNWIPLTVEYATESRSKRADLETAGTSKCPTLDNLPKDAGQYNSARALETSKENTIDKAIENTADELFDETQPLNDTGYGTEMLQHFPDKEDAGSGMSKDTDTHNEYVGDLPSSDIDVDFNPTPLLGVESINFQPIQPHFDSNSDSECVIDKEAVNRIKKLCDELSEDPFQVTSTPTKSVNEIRLVNDTGVGVGEGLGEVVNTDTNETVAQNETNDSGALVKQKPETKTNSKKIHRPCPFCADGKLHSALSRHIKLKHKNEPAVVQANLLPKKERIKAYEEMRKEGIYKFNIQEMKKDKPTYMRERTRNDVDEIVICSKCKGCYSKSYRARHQIHCGKDSGQVMIPAIAISSMIMTDISDDFKAVLNKMVLDEVSNVAKSDPFILVIGARIYNGQK